MAGPEIAALSREFAAALCAGGRGGSNWCHVLSVVRCPAAADGAGLLVGRLPRASARSVPNWRS